MLTTVKLGLVGFKPAGSFNFDYSISCSSHHFSLFGFFSCLCIECSEIINFILNYVSARRKNELFFKNSVGLTVERTKMPKMYVLTMS